MSDLVSFAAGLIVGFVVAFVPSAYFWVPTARKVDRLIQDVGSLSISVDCLESNVEGNRGWLTEVDYALQELRVEVDGHE